MLSTRSKILITIVTVAGLVALVNYMNEHASWSSEPAKDWYIEWIVVVALVVVTGLSVALDTRKSR